MNSGVRDSIWSVYVLYSSRLGRTYVGCAHDVALRLGQHNAGAVRATRNGIPWRVVQTELIGDYEQALHRERYFKSGAGRRKLHAMLSWDAALPAPR